MSDFFNEQNELDAILKEGGYQTVEMTYLCPKCGMVSYNRNDALNRYCGHCHTFSELEDIKEAIKDAPFH